MADDTGTTRVAAALGFEAAASALPLELWNICGSAADAQTAALMATSERMSAAAARLAMPREPGEAVGSALSIWVEMLDAIASQTRTVAETAAKIQACCRDVVARSGRP